MSLSSARAALQAYVDNINAGNAEAVAALFAPYAVVEDPVGSEPKTGDAIRSWFKDTVAFDTRIEPVAPIRGSHGNAAAVAFDVTFTPPGGPRLRIRSIDVCEVDEDGLIVGLKGFWGAEDMETAS